MPRESLERGLVVREIDEQRTVERIERVRDEGAGDGVVVGDQRTQVAGEHAVAAEQEAGDAAARSATTSAAGSRPRSPSASRRARRRRPRRRSAQCRPIVGSPARTRVPAGGEVAAAGRRGSRRMKR
jgi:hypothetical protein